MTPSAHRTRRGGASGLTVGLLAALALCAPASGAARASEGSRASAPGGAVVASLSNLTTFSVWAYPEEAAAVRLRPASGARAVDRLRFLTVDGQAQLYLALRSYTAGGISWTEVSLPRRPNGVTGWVPASALGELHVSRERLRVNRETLRATLYRNGRRIWQAPVGVGRPGLPTPAGHFYVTEKLTAIGGPFYGPYALATSAYAPTLTDWPGGGVIGIHGTSEPQLIPGRPSHGCIRMRNSDIVRLWPLVELGTPIEIV
jgi:hypothetical protein